MKRKARLRPLKNVVLRIVGVSMGIIFVFCMVMMAVEYRVLANMKGTIEKNNSFVSYYEKGEELNNTLADYIHTQQEGKKEMCRQLKQEFSGASEEMSETFEDAQFLDNYYLTDSYLDLVEKLLQTNESVLSQEQLKTYEDCKRVYGYIKENKNMLNSIRADIISRTYVSQFETWKKQFLFFAAIMALCGIYLFRFSSQMIRDILHPITFLTKQAERFRDGTYPAEQGQNMCSDVEETNILTAAFFEMAKTIRQQMQQLQEKMKGEQRLHQLEMQNMQIKVSLAETKMQLIQSMISPHFLFNCLNTLSGMAYFEKAPKTRESSQKIARYLRDSLALVGKNIPIREEILHTQHYIEIQQIRFGDRIQFSTVCEKTCDEFVVPAMILQPLVENCISHGLKNLWKEGQVFLSVQRDHNRILLCVKDNGAGMDRERLSQIRQELAQPFDPGKHTIGLHGVASRIKMFFRERVSMELKSVKGEGTEVLIEIDERETECLSGKETDHSALSAAL